MTGRRSTPPLHTPTPGDRERGAKIQEEVIGMLERVKQARTRNEDGFTLIELLIVIVILGILSAVVVFAVSGISDRGQASACATDENTLRTAQEAYYSKNKTYASEATLVSDKFLAETSALHNISLSGSGASASYEITGVSPC